MRNMRVLFWLCVRIPEMYMEFRAKKNSGKKGGKQIAYFGKITS